MKLFLSLTLLSIGSCGQPIDKEFKASLSAFKLGQVNRGPNQINVIRNFTNVAERYMIALSDRGDTKGFNEVSQWHRLAQSAMHEERVQEAKKQATLGYRLHAGINILSAIQAYFKGAPFYNVLMALANIPNALMLVFIIAFAYTYMILA